MSQNINTDKDASSSSSSSTHVSVIQTLSDQYVKNLSVNYMQLDRVSKELDNFSRTKGDKDSNITNLFTGKIYCIPTNSLYKIYHLLNECRKEKIVNHFLEKQCDPSGIMIDFDMFTADNNFCIKKDIYLKISNIVYSVLRSHLEIGGVNYIFFTSKNILTKVNDNDHLFKFGFHMLMPGIKVIKSYKIFLINKLRENKSLTKLFNNLGITNPEECIDKNSASVPVLFLGSCKRNSLPYKIVSQYEIEDDDIDSPFIIKECDVDLEKYNPVAELSLVGTVENSFITKQFVKCKSSILAECEKNKPNLYESMLDDEFVTTSNSLDGVVVSDPEARFLKSILDILPSDYYTLRNKWRDVIWALANTSPNYKPLAEYFSRKCPEKWDADALNKLWDNAIHCKSNTPLTSKSIIFWAKTEDPERYEIIANESYFNTLGQYVFQNEGQMGHYMVAVILSLMLKNKFCTDIEDGKKYTWYEFVVPNQSQKYGEMWKWRKEVNPDYINTYISDSLPNLYDNMINFINEKKGSADNDREVQFFSRLSKKFVASKFNLTNNNYKNSVIKECVFLFRRRGFVDQLDMMPDLFGVANGVLKLSSVDDPKCRLINYYHEFPISKYTPIPYRPFDPNEPNTRIFLNAVRDIIIEPDVRRWLLFHAAQGLSRAPKEGLILLMTGGGQNGKTSLLRLIAKALGPYADKFNIQLLSCDRETADRPNSAIMKFKYVNWVYSEESNKSEVLNTARLKELISTGEINSRDLNSKQETFTIRCNFIAASQHQFIINTNDHGTWRRILTYKTKIKFCSNPNGKFEKKENLDFNSKYVDNNMDMAIAVLSTIVYFHEKLFEKYGGLLKNVPCPTLDAETEEYRTEQDSIHRWICEKVVTTDKNIEYSMQELTMYYNEWYKISRDKRVTMTATMFEKDIGGSAISKYLHPTLNGTSVLRGCRVLTPDNNTLYESENYISIRKTLISSDIKLDDKKQQWWTVFKQKDDY